MREELNLRANDKRSTGEADTKIGHLVACYATIKAFISLVNKGASINALSYRTFGDIISRIVHCAIVPFGLVRKEKLTN